MREIEIKARVTDEKKVRDVLLDLGCEFSDSVEQCDVIFLREGRRLLDVKTGDPVLRVREEGGIVKLTYKEHVSNQFDCIEEELEVSDKDTMIRIIEKLGFVEVSRVRKKRVTTKYKDYEICLDDVDGLGVFVEVEKIVPYEEGGGVQDELYAFLFELGFEKSDIVTDGYDVMIHKKNLKL